MNLKEVFTGQHRQEDYMAEKRVYFLWGDKLDLTRSDGTPLLEDGKLVRPELLSQEGSAGALSIRILNEFGGGTIYPLEIAVGKKGLERFREDYARTRAKLKDRLVDGRLPIFTYDVWGMY